MSKADVVRADLVVRPIRFTDYLPRMRDFLALLGFSPRVSRGEIWATMAGAAGEVALHDAGSSAQDAGDTGLMFEVADADALATRLAEAGFADVQIYDEAWGRVLQVRGRAGAELSFDERPTDWDGYHVDEPQPEHGVVSMPLLYGPPTGPLDGLLSAAGLVRLEEGDDESWRVWSTGSGGLVARHPAGAKTPAGTVRMAFRTREPLPELARRLNTAGYVDTALSDDFGGELTVLDPDGQQVLVQPA